MIDLKFVSFSTWQRFYPTYEHENGKPLQHFSFLSVQLKKRCSKIFYPSLEAV